MSGVLDAAGALERRLGQIARKAPDRQNHTGQDIPGELSADPVRTFRIIPVKQQTDRHLSLIHI